MQTAPESVSLREVMHIIVSLPDDKLPAIYEYALSLLGRSTGTGTLVGDQRAWGQLAIKSLAPEWDTPEEDEAWAYMQKDK